METSRKLHIGMGALLGLSLCFVSDGVFAGDAKVYNGNFCQGDFHDAKANIPGQGFYSGANQGVTCPIIRDMTIENRYPEVRVRGFKLATGTTTCRVHYLNEDWSGFANESDAPPVVRGFSNSKSSSSTGEFEFRFDSGADYGWNPQQLSSENGSPSEGTMALHCNLKNGDAIHQYYVNEDKVAWDDPEP